jgi:hypothetical protein
MCDGREAKADSPWSELFGPVQPIDTMSSQRLSQVVWMRLFLTERFLSDDAMSYQELTTIRSLRFLA